MARTSRDQRRRKAIDALNKARALELHAIRQYVNQRTGLDDRDSGERAANRKRLALEERRHPGTFAERIEELGGEPATDVAVKVRQADAMSLVEAAREDDTREADNGFVPVCRENGASPTRERFETVIDEEQTHANEFNNVREHVATLGASSLAGIAGTPADSGFPSKGVVTGGGNV